MSDIPRTRTEAPPLGFSSEPHPVSTASKPVSLTLVVGQWYELSCDGPIRARAGKGRPTRNDRQVIPQKPMVFIADVATITITAATSTDCTAWLRREFHRE